MTDKFTQVPQNIVDATELFDNWLSGIISEFFVISEKASHAREYEILQYRYGLNGRTILTLEETGIIFDVTRERIRQIEKKATESLSELINDGASKNRKLALNPNLHSKLMQFKENLKQIDQIVSEDSIVSYYNAPRILDKKRGHVKLENEL